MINLIKNEFSKIFKKKTIYILLFITLAYIILSNIVIKATNDNNSYYYYDDDVKYYEWQLAELDPEDASDLSMYIDTKVNLETSKLIKEYGSDSWQAYIISSVLPTHIYTIDRKSVV